MLIMLGVMSFLYFGGCRRQWWSGYPHCHSPVCWNLLGR